MENNKVHEFDNGDRLEMRQEIFHFACHDPIELIEVVYLEKDRLDDRTVYNCLHSQYVLPEDASVAAEIFEKRLASKEPDNVYINETVTEANDRYNDVLNSLRSDSQFSI